MNDAQFKEVMQRLDEISILLSVSHTSDKLSRATAMSRAGVSQARISKLLGIDPAQLSRHLSGKKKITRAKDE